eukprot:2114962-Rhodomonas_salina.1
MEADPRDVEGLFVLLRIQSWRRTIRCVRTILAVPLAAVQHRLQYNSRCQSSFGHSAVPVQVWQWYRSLCQYR